MLKVTLLFEADNEEQLLDDLVSSYALYPVGKADAQLRHEFARRLQQLRKARGLSPSDLARACWGDTVNRTGVVAKNRDRIAVYEKGRTLPDPANLALLVKALNTTREELGL